jgi:2-phospho-L-lactate guanylyltransferase
VTTSPTWAAVVPVKGGPLSKSRLALPRDVRVALATAFARDTVAALRRADPRMPVLVVTGAPDVAEWARGDGADVVADPGTGLDGAVAAGVAAAGPRGASHAAVVLGDHPALRPEEVRAALALASGHDRTIVPDAVGSGTALLGMPTAPVVRTAFGAGSAAAHVLMGFVALEAEVPGLRLDVDDAQDLAAAVRLGVGRHTGVALARASLPSVQASIHRAPAPDEPGAALLDDGVEVVVPFEALAESGLRHLRVGQRVSIELDAEGRSATRVWVVGIGRGETVR